MQLARRQSTGGNFRSSEYTDCVDWLEAESWEAVEVYFAADGGQAETLDSHNPRMRSLVIDSLVGDLGLAV